MTTEANNTTERKALNLVQRIVANRLEKARVIDPLGHAGFDPSGEIRLTP